MKIQSAASDVNIRHYFDDIGGCGHNIIRVKSEKVNAQLSSLYLITEETVLY